MFHFITFMVVVVDGGGSSASGYMSRFHIVYHYKRCLSGVVVGFFSRACTTE